MRDVEDEEDEEEEVVSELDPDEGTLLGIRHHLINPDENQQRLAMKRMRMKKCHKAFREVTIIHSLLLGTKGTGPMLFVETISEFSIILLAVTLSTMRPSARLQRPRARNSIPRMYGFNLMLPSIHSLVVLGYAT
jgi:hypothetical protein